MSGRVVSTVNGVEFVTRTACLVDPGHRLRHVRSVASMDAVYGRYDILFCDACGIGHTSPYPSPETVGALYADRSQSLNFTGGEGGADQGDVMRSIKRFFADRSVRALVKEHGSATSLLDYGCGNGYFALIVQQAHPDLHVTALDFHEGAPAALAGTPVRYVSAAGFLAGSEKYDVIHLRDVLEHIHDPVGFLTLLRSRLQENGVIYIKVPNPFNAWARIWGQSGDHSYYVPYHITHYTSRGLGNVVRLSGLSGRQFGMEIPLTSNYLAELLGLRLSNPLRIIGAAFFPLHLLVNKLAGSSNHLCCIATTSG